MSDHYKSASTSSQSTRVQDPAAHASLLIRLRQRARARLPAQVANASPTISNQSRQNIIDHRNNGPSVSGRTGTGKRRRETTESDQNSGESVLNETQASASNDEEEVVEIVQPSGFAQIQALAQAQASRRTRPRLHPSSPDTEARVNATTPLASRSRTIPQVNVPVQKNTYTRLSVQGAIPPTGCLQDCRVVDHEAQILYIVGTDDDRSPWPAEPSRFFAFHFSEMRWKDYTNITRKTSSLQTPILLNHHRLPPMLNACCDVWSHEGRKKLIIFGGRRSTRSCTNEFISIDLDSFMWSPLPVSGGSPQARQSACMVIIGKRLHIFGGILDGDDDTHMPAYSIAEYQTNDESTNGPGWRWLFCDKPYPSHLAPSQWHALDALPVYDKRKILLIAGKKIVNSKRDEIFVTSGDMTVLYHVKNQTFQPQIGTDLNLSPEKFDQDVLYDKTSDSVLILCWSPGDWPLNCPEVWRYRLPPEEDCQRLPVASDLAREKLELTLPIVCRGRCFIFGCNRDGAKYHNEGVELLLDA